ncbi:MAG: HlyD family secretion protein [Candidatus Eremiobacteraeota bacterium]|nr:HlyD family secretion protein [Candidatus Eremiobacteraeota bacterium]
MRGTLSLALRIVATAIAVVAAGFVGWRMWVIYMDEPWTRDGVVRADVVQVTADVSGLVLEVPVHDNKAVHRGDVLFRIDPVRFQLALEQAEAAVLNQQAATQEAVRETNRFAALSNLSISEEQKQQRAAVAVEDAAGYQQAVANRDVARLNLTRSEVQASVNGVISNFDLRPGDYVNAGHPVFALIDSDSFHVDAYFEETKLPHIKVGNPARIHLMGEHDYIEGHVESIAGGIADRERQASGDLLANVNPTFNWVRLAQRIPVRIALDHVPAGIKLVMGRTATVEVLPAGSTHTAQ